MTATRRFVRAFTVGFVVGACLFVLAAYIAEQAGA